MELTDTIESLLSDKGSDIWRVSTKTLVIDAIALMAEKKIGALLVIDEGKLVGIVSERDYARRVTLMGKSSRETPVREIMSSPVIHVTSKETRLALPGRIRMGPARRYRQRCWNN